MQDRNGSEIRTGDVVKVAESCNGPLFNCWIIMGFLKHELAVEVILQHYHSKEIDFVHILDIERPFGA